MSSRGLIEDAVIEVCAKYGLSRQWTADLIHRSRSHVALRARLNDISFNGAPGCTPEQAMQGWATRRATGWQHQGMTQRVNRVR